MISGFFDIFGIDLRLIYALLLIPSVFVLRRRPLVSLKNVAIITFVFPMVLGAFLLPYAIELDKFNVVDLELYVYSIRLAMVFIWLSLLIFLLSILVLDKMTSVVFAHLSCNKAVRYIMQLEGVPAHRAINVFVFFIGLGSFLILMTFWQTGNVPYINYSASAKYFDGFADDYIPLRPLYVLGQQILAVTGFILLIYLLSKRDTKGRLIFVASLSISTVILVLTLKRGELFFPFTMALGGLIISNKLKKHNVLAIISIVFAVLFLATLLQPGDKERPFDVEVARIFPDAYNAQAIIDRNDNPPALVEPEAKNAVKPPERAYFRKLDYIRTLVDISGVQIREASRLIYNFKYQNHSYLTGRTYVAGILGFIPTSIFPFKGEYQIGRVTARLFGADVETAAGARIGGIAEAYINFGYLGVIVLPVLLGILIWYLDRIYISIYTSKSEDNNIIAMSAIYFTFVHLGFGIFGDGSSAIQIFIIRVIIIGTIMFFLTYRIGDICSRK